MTPPIILSRRELYDLVWSKPMRDVAAELGISDVGLSKVCERHRVPRPEQGYWNKKNAGKKVKQTLFVETDDPSVNRVEVRGGLSQVPEAARQVIEKARAARKTVEQQRDQPAPAPAAESVAEPHKAISRTAKVLRKGSPDRNGGVVAWARARLSTLEATTDPHNLNEDLKAKKLFPETDDLADPLGELSDESPYW